MPANRWSRKPRLGRRYGWVFAFQERDPRVRALSREAREGHYYAWELATNARDRRLEVFHGYPPERLTVKRLADYQAVSAKEVYARLRQLRLELFGRELSDSAIYHRLRQERKRAQGQPRPCAEEGCEQLIPADAIASRRYCERHAGPVARVTRARLRARQRRLSGELGQKTELRPVRGLSGDPVELRLDG